jgi:hypothetical protein
MAMKLSTTLSHITTIPNSINSKSISEFYNYMKSIGTSENYQNQNLKAIIVYEVSRPRNNLPIIN